MVDRDQRTKGHVAHPTRMHEPSLLLTDLYEFSMLEAYAAHGMAETAVFEVFVRKLPAGRGFLMAAGLAQVVDFLETMRLTSDELGWLGAPGMFSPAFVEGLADLYFTGDVDAMPEGTPFFPDEPVLRVVAPLRQAQLVETRLINLAHFQTIIASKAARMVLAVPGKLALCAAPLRLAQRAAIGSKPGGIELDQCFCAPGRMVLSLSRGGTKLCL